nr:hypothetical protein [Tanacetum cinerariifolium]
AFKSLLGLAMMLLGRVPELKVEALLEFTNLAEKSSFETPCFEELELDKQELGKLEEVKFDLTSSEDDSWYFLGCS